MDIPAERPAHRPPKINADRLAKILKAVAAGCYFNAAAQSAGVSRATASRWRAQGEHALSAAKLEDPEIEDALDDWLMVWPDNFNANNAIWDAPPPAPFTTETWIYVLFAILLDKARGRAEVELVKQIKTAGKKQWQANAWLLERTRPTEFGRNQTIAHTGPEGGPVQVSAASPEVVLAALEDLRRKRAEGKV